MALKVYGLILVLLASIWYGVGPVVEKVTALVLPISPVTISVWVFVGVPPLLKLAIINPVRWLVPVTVSTIWYSKNIETGPVRAFVTTGTIVIGAIADGNTINS